MVEQIFYNVQSEKILYGQQLQMAALNFNAEIFVWGEELIDKRLIIYPHKLKEIADYESLKINLEPCSLVVIDPNKKRGLRCISATVDTVTGNVYLSEKFFNQTWEILKNSINTGILLVEKEQNCSSPITTPEEILDFHYLERSGSVPVLSKNHIVYQAKEITEEEKYKNSKKQSLLDNPRILYFYDRNGTCFHDKECDEVHRIPTENLEAAEEMPELEVCPKCQWKIYLRKACYPNHKQIGICEKILKDHNVSIKKLRHCVMDIGMKFHATSLEEMTVEGKADTWIIKGLQNKNCTLWHNNYVKTSPTERYITEGFHRQKLSNKTLSQVLYYIEEYSFTKHLEMEKYNTDIVNERAVEVLGKMDSANEIKHNHRCKEIRMWRFLKKGVGKMKKLFDILLN